MKLSSINESFLAPSGIRSVPDKIMPDKEDIYKNDVDIKNTDDELDDELNDRLMKLNIEKPILKEPDDNLEPDDKAGPS